MPPAAGALADANPAAAPSTGPGLVGRDAELNVIGGFLEQVGRDEGPAALVLEGEAGIGKTALWRHTVDTAARLGYHVLRAAPDRADRDLAYAALRDLLQRVPAALIDSLPSPQGRAVRVITLDLEAGAPVERGSVSVAFLGLLRQLAESDAVVIAIDDVQWLDEPTRAVLAFALRRLELIRLGAVMTARGPGGAASALGLDRALPAARIACLPLTPLSVATLFQLLKARLGHSFPRPVLTRVADLSGGNPLFALELGRAVIGRGETVGPGVPLPALRGLDDVLGSRMRSLSAEERHTLLIAAAAAHPTRTLVRSVSRRLHWRTVFPEGADILDSGEEVLHFAHPLFSAEALRIASSRERRLVHRALGLVIEDREQRARHLALGATRPDEGVAAALDEALRLAATRGAPESAADLADLAGRLTPPTDAPSLLRRRRELASLLMLTGDTGRAVHVLGEAIADGPDGSDRSLARSLLAQLALEGGDRASALEQCRLAVEEANGDPLARARAELAWAAAAHDAREQLSHAEQALASVDERSAGLRASALVSVVALTATTGGSMRDDLLEEALRLEELEPPPRILAGAAAARAWLHTMDDQLDQAHAEYLALAGRAQERGDESSLARISVELAQIDLRAGRWEELPVHADDALRIAEWTEHEHDRALALVQLGALAASRGDRANAERHLGEARDYAARAGDLFIAAIVAGNLGTLALGEGDAGTAVALLAESARQFGALTYADPALSRFHADHLEALAGVGALEEATALADAVEAQARRVGRRRPIALVARGRGYIAAARGELDAALHSFEQSYDELVSLGMRFEAARSLLGRGTVQRRLRHKRSGHDDLRAALATFESLGAVVWADRARRELARVGLRPHAPASLTATEREVALLAANGRTNREIATLAFMSPRTVEGVMARIYAKLGIGSRAELGRAMTDADAVGRAHPRPAPPAT